MPDWDAWRRIGAWRPSQAFLRLLLNFFAALITIAEPDFNRLS
jgi:hypothetical protein